MVSMLKNGEIIDLNLLRKRFDRALVKKIGVVNTPYPFWSSDPKINPLTKELIWAAILLEDSNNFQLLSGVAVTEANEKKRASGKVVELAGTGTDYKKITDAFLREFLELAPDDDFRKTLRDKIDITAI
ncbi:hypothetical protein ACFLYW_04230 [Thermodesulfobacteriota bacterium]